MASRIEEWLQERIRTGEYVMTLHAEEEMADDGLSLFDVENIVLAGGVGETQIDRSTGERKYRIEGQTESGAIAEVVAKKGSTGKMVIITVYLK
mgnify:CR=1 FL=1